MRNFRRMPASCPSHSANPSSCRPSASGRGGGRATSRCLLTTAFGACRNAREPFRRLAQRRPSKDAATYQHHKGPDMPVDTKAATDRLMRFLAIEGVTGQEAAIGRELSAALKESGVPAKAIRLDDANTRIPVPTETGNLIVDLPGRGALHNQPRIMFMTHMDTVPLCAGAKPK